MALGEAQEAVKRIRYRDLQISLWLPESQDGFELKIWRPSKCIYTGELGPLLFRQILHALPETPRDLFDLILDLVKRLEMHEVTEMFLVDEAHWVNPHPETWSPNPRTPTWLIEQYRGASELVKLA